MMREIRWVGVLAVLAAAACGGGGGGEDAGDAVDNTPFITVGNDTIIRVGETKTLSMPAGTVFPVQASENAFFNSQWVNGPTSERCVFTVNKDKDSDVKGQSYFLIGLEPDSTLCPFQFRFGHDVAELIVDVQQ